MRLNPISPAAFCGLAENVALLKKKNTKGVTQAVMSITVAGQLLSNQELLKSFPEIKNISSCPVFVKDKNNILKIITGYHEETKVFAEGVMPTETKLENGIELILDLLADFQFASEADKSRAVALILSPGLLHGGALDERVPMFVIEGDSPGCGKGTLANMVAGIYNAKFANITMRKGGVGSLDESIGAALENGNGFILFDNVRGKLDSQLLESALTETYIQVRLPYKGNTDCDVTRNIVVLTSNGCELTQDLARRVLVIRLEKQADGYKFKYQNIIKHVQKNQPLCLGAVFAVLRNVVAHNYIWDGMTNLPSFDVWASAIDFVVQNFFGLPPLLEGNKSSIDRMSNQALSWLREVAMLIIKSGMVDYLSATDIFQEIDGTITIPGLKPNEDEQQAGVIRIGNLMKWAFGDDDEIVIDGMKIERIKKRNDFRNELKLYRFTRA